MLSYWSGVATLTGIYLIATLGVSILVGFTGLFSLNYNNCKQDHPNKKKARFLRDIGQAS